VSGYLEVSRRGFVQAILVATTGVWGRVRALFAEPPAGGLRSTALAERLAGCVREGGSARAIGRAYLAARAPRASVQEVAGRLWPPGLDPRGTGQAGELRQALLERFRADFAAGRIVSVDGWVLSETEAQLCALIAQLPGRG
jgi:hypothetical protein